jgi:hypothetical protein
MKNKRRNYRFAKRKNEEDWKRELREQQLKEAHLYARLGAGFYAEGDIL